MKRKLYIFLGFFFIIFSVLLLMYLQVGNVYTVIVGLIGISAIFIPIGLGFYFLEKSRWWIL